MQSLTSQIMRTSLSQVGLTVLAFAGGVALIELLVYLAAGKLFKAKNALVYMLLAPASHWTRAPDRLSHCARGARGLQQHEPAPIQKSRLRSAAGI